MVDELAEEEFIKPITTHNKSISSVLIHLAEEYFGWYSDIHEYKIEMEEIDRINAMSKDELMGYVKGYHEKWQDLLNNAPKENFSFTENEKSFKISFDEVIFNLVNHSSYHRGQIASGLRSLNKEVDITDYYWFKVAMA